MSELIVTRKLCNQLIEMFNSPDKENQHVALEIIKNHFDFNIHPGYLAVLYISCSSTEFMVYYQKNMTEITKRSFMELINYEKLSKIEDLEQISYTMKMWHDYVKYKFPGINIEK